MIKITNSPDINQWSEFVYNHPYGNIFQTPEMTEVYKRTKNYEPITLAAIDTKNDEILAVLQTMVIKETCILTHPERWSDNFGAWLKELMWQNVKNAGKAILVKRAYYDKNKGI